MKQVYRITQDGFFVEDVLLPSAMPAPEDCVEEQPKPGFFWPKWNGTEWVEGGGLYRREEDGSVNPEKRFDPVVHENGSIQRTEDGILVQRDKDGKQLNEE